VGDPQAIAVTQHNLGVGHVLAGEYDSAWRCSKAPGGHIDEWNGETAALTEMGGRTRGGL
jgi:hypothetical protein